MMHILERSIIHFFAGGTVYLMAFFGYHYCLRKFPRQMHIVMPGVLAVLIIALREPWDVANGQWIGKVPFDFGSWSAGIAVAIWGLYRYRKLA